MDGCRKCYFALMAAVISAFASPHFMPLDVLASEQAVQQGRVGTILSSCLFPGTKVFLQCRPEHGERGFSAPFEATPGLDGGPVVLVDPSLELWSPDSNLDKPVLGRSWKQDIFAQLLAAVWGACGSTERLTSSELSKSSSRLHKEALARARESGGAGCVTADPEDIYHPFDQTFCFANEAVEKRGWKLGTGAVCFDIIRAAYRNEFESRSLSENSVVISVAIPGPTIFDGDGRERIATFQERLETVEEVAAKLMDATYTYNNEIATRIPALPVIEVLRLEPVPVAEDPRLTDRESESEESQSTFFSLPEETLIEGTAEAVELSRAMLRGLSKAYRRLREEFISDCRLGGRKILSGNKMVSGDAAGSPVDNSTGGAGTPGKLRGGPLVKGLGKKPVLRCVRFPLPILDLAYAEGDIYQQALKAEEVAQPCQE